MITVAGNLWLCFFVTHSSKSSALFGADYSIIMPQCLLWPQNADDGWQVFALFRNILYSTDAAAADQSADINPAGFLCLPSDRDFHRGGTWHSHVIVSTKYITVDIPRRKKHPVTTKNRQEAIWPSVFGRSSFCVGDCCWRLRTRGLCFSDKGSFS